MPQTDHKALQPQSKNMLLTESESIYNKININKQTVHTSLCKSLLFVELLQTRFTSVSDWIFNIF